MDSSTLLPDDQVRRRTEAGGAVALVQAGGCMADTCWKIQAALPAAVERGGQQHQDLLSSEAFSLLHDIVSVDAAGTGGSASAHVSNASSLAPSRA
jgi:AP2-like factor, ANT lineage